MVHIYIHNPSCPAVINMIAAAAAMANYFQVIYDSVFCANEVIQPGTTTQAPVNVL